jgi:hypothetical protein
MIKTLFTTILALCLFCCGTAFSDDSGNDKLPKAKATSTIAVERPNHIEGESDMCPIHSNYNWQRGWSCYSSNCCSSWIIRVFHEL